MFKEKENVEIKYRCYLFMIRVSSKTRIRFRSTTAPDPVDFEVRWVIEDREETRGSSLDLGVKVTL